MRKVPACVRSLVVSVFSYVALCGVGNIAAAANFYWTGAVDATWGGTEDTTTNWSSTIDGPSTATADSTGANDFYFGANSAANLTTTMGAAYTIDRLNINANAPSLSITTTNANPLTFNSHNSTRTILSVAANTGTHTFAGSDAGSSQPQDWSFGSNLAPGGTSTFLVGANSTFVINGRVGGGPNSRQYVKSGNGTLVLGGNNGGSGAWNFAATGLFTVSEGILRLTQNNASGNSGNPYTVANGATLQLSGAGYGSINGVLTLHGTGVGGIGALNSLAGNNAIVSGNGSISLASASRIGVTAGTLAVSQTITGSGTLEKSGDGRLTLNAANTYSAVTTVAEGALRITNANALGTTGSGTTVNGGVATSRLELSEGINVAAEPLTLRGRSTTASHLVNVSGNNTWNGAISFVTDGSTYTIESEAGLLTIASSISGASTTGSRNLRLDGTGAGLVSGAIVNGNATVTLAKEGTGTWTLSGVNTYSGATSVNAGTLEIAAGGSTHASSAVTVSSTGSRLVVNGTVHGSLLASAGTLIEGTGTIGGSATIQGLHSPGNSPGIQTFGSDLAYSGGSSVVNWELVGNTTTNPPNPDALYDQVLVGGNLDFADATTLNLSFDGVGSAVDWADSFWSFDHSWVLYDVNGSTSNFGNLTLATTNWLDGDGVMFATARPQASFSVALSGTNVVLEYVAVPEPATALLVGIAGIGGLLVFLARSRAAPAGP